MEINEKYNRREVVTNESQATEKHRPSASKAPLVTQVRTLVAKYTAISLVDFFFSTPLAIKSAWFAQLIAHVEDEDGRKTALYRIYSYYQRKRHHCVIVVGRRVG